MPTDGQPTSSGGGTGSDAANGVAGGAPRRTLGAILFAALQEFSTWVELIRKVAVSAAIVIGVTVAAFLICRSVYQEGIVIEPVIIQLADSRDGLTPELAALEIAKHIDKIQRAGVSEWRKLYVDQAADPIDLQIPGAPFTLRGGMRDIAALVGSKPPTIRASIAGGTASSPLIATVSVEGHVGAQATCKPDVAAGMDGLLECIALNAMSFIDPKVAASYVFNDEAQKCTNLDADQPAEASAVVRERQRIVNRRARCAFERTQALIAKVLERGRAEDLPWVPYVYGEVHLARASAAAEIDREEQLSELDQAIGRFAVAKTLMPESTSAIAVLFEAYVQKGISIHQATAAMQWSDDPTSPLQWRLYLAEATFAEAEKELNKLPERRPAALDALVRSLEGSLYYRQWMIKAHRRTKSAALTVAANLPEEVALLKQAKASYEAAARNARSFSLFMDWGNVLRASTDFEGAVSKYLLAADLSPDRYEPRINLAIAYLERVIYGNSPADPIEVLVALGATSNYLTWVSQGDPAPNLQAEIERALGATGFPEDLEKFNSFRAEALAHSTPDPWLYVAGRKYCIDQAIRQVNARVISAPRTPVKAGAR